MTVHGWDEINTPEFWKFLEESVRGFEKFTEKLQQNPDDVMPWKVLGRRWHLSRKGFPPGKRVHWDTEVLEDLCELLTTTAPQAQFLWNNQQVVHLMAGASGEPWATIHTKNPQAVLLDRLYFLEQLTVEAD